MKILILASLLGVSALGGVANAQEVPPAPPADAEPMHHGRGRMGPMDAPGMRAMLPQPDANGVITKEAMLADARERALKRFERLDTNHDGKLDQNELEAANHRMFAMRERHRDRSDRDFAPPPPSEDGPPPPPPADAPPPPGS